MRALAKDIGKGHQLALDLWRTGVHEALILSSLLAESEKLTEEQTKEMVRGFDSRDLCDRCCSNLFSWSLLGFQKSLEWSERNEEFQKRAGFANMAALAVHAKGLRHEELQLLLDAVIRESHDDRNFARKAVNWALRQIGKRDLRCNGMAIDAAERILAKGDRAFQWVSTDALRELRGEALQQRLKSRQKR